MHVKMKRENEENKREHLLYCVKIKFELLPGQKTLWNTCVFHNDIVQVIHSLLLGRFLRFYFQMYYTSVVMVTD